MDGMHFKIVSLTLYGMLRLSMEMELNTVISFWWFISCISKIRVERLNVLTLFIDWNLSGMTIPSNIDLGSLISVDFGESIKNVWFYWPAIFKINWTLRNSLTFTTHIYCVGSWWDSSCCTSLDTPGVSVSTVVPFECWMLILSVKFFTKNTGSVSTTSSIDCRNSSHGS